MFIQLSAMFFWFYIAYRFAFHGLMTYHHHLMDNSYPLGKIIYWGIIWFGTIISVTIGVSIVW